MVNNFESKESDIRKRSNAQQYDDGKYTYVFSGLFLKNCELTKCNEYDGCMKY